MVLTKRALPSCPSPQTFTSHQTNQQTIHQSIIQTLNHTKRKENSTSHISIRGEVIVVSAVQDDEKFDPKSVRPLRMNAIIGCLVSFKNLYSYSICTTPTCCKHLSHHLFFELRIFTCVDQTQVFES